MALIVLAIALISLFIPQSALWISTSWINYLLMVVMFGMGMTLKPESFILVFKRPKDILKWKEEIAEFEAEMRKCPNDPINGQMVNDQMVNEFGDLLFALINAARLYKIRPDNALEQTNLKFMRRFNYLEARAKEQGRDLKDMTIDEMEALWQEAKALEGAA